jgi:mono/diheme cytochrome c family protein
MARRLALFLIPGLMVLGGATAFGGWAVITVDDLPEHARVGQALALGFIVRQHGVTPLNGLRPTIEATSGGKVVTAVPTAGTQAGQYAGSVTLPSAGNWTITIHSRFGPSKVTLMPIEVLPAGKNPVHAMTDAERGERLFLAKGCASCHVHRGVASAVIAEVGPDLTEKRYQAEYLAQYLANPAIRASSQPGRIMPNLGLERAEIAALVSFINAERTTSSGR